MRSRLGAMAVLAVLTASLVTVTGTAAQAAGVSVRSSVSVPILNEDVRVYGAAPKAGRVVQLQTVRGGRWVGVRSSRTNRSGAYSFTVRATSAAARYRVYAPKVKKVPASASGSVTVRGVKPTLTFAPPVSVGGAVISAASAIASPARPGTVVRLLRNSGSGYVVTATARQSAAGVVKFPVSVGTGAGYRFQAQILGRTGVTAPSAKALTLSGTTFSDGFDGSTLDPRWRDRVDPKNPYLVRKCSKTAEHMVTLGGGFANFRVRPNSDAAKMKQACPYGTWDNPTIGTGRLLTQPYGYYAAKVKFQQARGMHGAFWLQGGTEIDVAEHFGYHRPISNLIHSNASDPNTGNFSVGGDQPQTRTILGKSTPYTGFHTYSVQWTRDQYVFMLDGVPTLVTDKKKSGIMGAEIILSLQTSPWELPALKTSTVSTSSATMQVDWVRAYQ